MDKISAKRMKAAFVDWLPDYHENGITNQTKFLLHKMSVSTLGRFLKILRKTEQKKIRVHLSTTTSQKIPLIEGDQALECRPQF